MLSIKHNHVSVEEVIISTLTQRGDGKITPIRDIVQVFSKDGHLIAERDDFIEEYSKPVMSYGQVEALVRYIADQPNAFNEDPIRLFHDWLAHAGLKSRIIK